MLAFIVPRAIEIDIIGNRSMTMISISTEKMSANVLKCPEMSANVLFMSGGFYAIMYHVKEGWTAQRKMREKLGRKGQKRDIEGTP